MYDLLYWESLFILQSRQIFLVSKVNNIFLHLIIMIIMETRGVTHYHHIRLHYTLLFFYFRFLSDLSLSAWLAWTFWTWLMDFYTVFFLRGSWHCIGIGSHPTKKWLDTRLEFSHFFLSLWLWCHLGCQKLKRQKKKLSYLEKNDLIRNSKLVCK